MVAIWASSVGEKTGNAICIASACKDQVTIVKNIKSKNGII